MAPPESCGLSLGGKEQTYDGNDLLLNLGGSRNELEVEGEVELRGSSISDCFVGSRWDTREGSYRAHEEREGDGLLGAGHGYGCLN